LHDPRVARHGDTNDHGRGDDPLHQQLPRHAAVHLAAARHERGIPRYALCPAPQSARAAGTRVPRRRDDRAGDGAAGGRRRGARAVPLTWRVNSTMMRVDLDPALPPRATTSLTVAWHHQIPRNGRTGREHFTTGWLYQVAQWYPRAAVYDDARGWNTDQYIGSAELLPP